ncbi:MAG: N-terminal phage integrase SAM-like domain-containing protein [Oscillospiraceae bacterium]
MNIDPDIELSADMTLKEWLEYWFEVYTKRTVKQSTAVSYHGYINGHIVPHIGSYKLSELNTDIFQSFLMHKVTTAVLKAVDYLPKHCRISAE